MGRETRQQRRVNERRERAQPTGRTINWPLLGGIAVVLAIVAFFASQTLGLGSSSHKQVADKPIDGIPCGQETVTYHVHAHLTILDQGKPVVVPAQTGFGSTGCLYWLHTHDTSGVIHIEGPSSSFHPTLGKFFDIAQKTNGQPILPAIKSGQELKVYVNQKPYSGDPRNITLLAHTTITIEFGPPFKPPQKYAFGTL